MLEEEIINPRYPHDILIYRAFKQKTEFDSPVGDDDDNPFAEDDSDTKPIEDTRTVLYEGKGRSYTDTTTTGDGKVESNKRKISIPVRFDKWKKDLYPLDGDIVEVTMGNVKENGTVKDFEPDNNRSVVYWELLRV